MTTAIKPTAFFTIFHLPTNLFKIFNAEGAESTEKEGTQDKYSFFLVSRLSLRVLGDLCVNNLCLE